MTDEEFLLYLKEIDESIPEASKEEKIKSFTALFESNMIQYLALGKKMHLKEANRYLKMLEELDQEHKHKIFNKLLK